MVRYKYRYYDDKVINMFIVTENTRWNYSCAFPKIFIKLCKNLLDFNEKKNDCGIKSQFSK